MEFIHLLEEETGIKAIKNMLPMQIGDVESTFANTDDLAAVTGFKPHTPLNVRVARFVRWYRNYYNLGNR